MSTHGFGPPQDYYDHLQPQTGIERGTPETDPSGTAAALNAIYGGSAADGSYVESLLDGFAGDGDSVGPEDSDVSSVFAGSDVDYDGLP